MKAIILAGGKGLRLGPISKLTPKPMVKIGNKPILWHILKLLSNNGINDFLICLGYKGNVIKKYVSTIKENWNIECVDTGLNTLTAKRIGLIKDKIKDDFFLMTYGDGLANININKLIKTHLKKKKIATVTAVAPIPRFGSIKIKNGLVSNFNEKPIDTTNLINGGFFILDKKIFDFVDLKKNVMWEQEPMMKLAKEKQLTAYHHKGFWHPMDTERDKKLLNNLFKKGAPWIDR
jgi:glucose-1-phosphate cytidylyltransferase